MIYIKDNYLFLVNYKCGYSTFEKMRHEGIVTLYQGALENTRHMKSYLVCRDPYKKLESFYKDKLFKSMSWPFTQNCQKRLAKFFSVDDLVDKKVTFEEFIKAIKRGYRDEHIAVQSHSFYIQPKHIVKLEDGLECFTEILGVNPNDYICNETNDILVDTNWTEEMRNIVNKHYVEDFVKLGYNML